MSLADLLMSACRPRHAGKDHRLPSGAVVLMLHGSWEWAGVWARASGWRALSGRRGAWVTPGGIRVIGVDRVEQILQGTLDRYFVYGPFADVEIVAAARLAGLTEIADASLS